MRFEHLVESSKFYSFLRLMYFTFRTKNFSFNFILCSIFKLIFLLCFMQITNIEYYKRYIVITYKKVKRNNIFRFINFC